MKEFIRPKLKNALHAAGAAATKNWTVERSAFMAMEHCARWLAWRHYYVAGESRLLHTRTCKKHLLCPFCATRRAARMMARYDERVALELERDPKLLLRFVTLTVKNGPDLRERFNHLHQSFKRFQKRACFGSSEWGNVQGAVWSFETKRGKTSGEWHPHVHGVWLCREEIDIVKLREQWLSITGDSKIVDARPLSENKAAAFAEVFKYALKFSELPLADNYDAWCVLRGRRLIASAGCLHGVNIPDISSDDQLDDARYYDLLFKYQAGQYKFAGHVSADSAIAEKRGNRGKHSAWPGTRSVGLTWSR